MKNQVVDTVLSELGKFYLKHESTILTGGTIGFSLATTAVAIKNSKAINYILDQAALELANCETKEEKNAVYAQTLKELAPQVGPVIIFQLATIGCTIVSKCRADKKLNDAKEQLAATASALVIANEAVSRYQDFQKRTEEALGEKRYNKLQSDIFANQEVDGRRFNALPYEGAPGEDLFIDKYSGRPFWCTCDRLKNAANELGRRLSPSGGYDQQTVSEWYDLIGNPDLTPNELSNRYGYISQDVPTYGIDARFADTHYIFPNGTRRSATEVYLYPEPASLDWGC